MISLPLGARVHTIRESPTLETKCPVSGMRIVFELLSPSLSMAAEILACVGALEELSVVVELAVRTTLGMSNKVASSERWLEVRCHRSSKIVVNRV